MLDWVASWFSAEDGGKYVCDPTDIDDDDWVVCEEQKMMVLESLMDSSLQSDPPSVQAISGADMKKSFIEDYPSLVPEFLCQEAFDEAIAISESIKNDPINSDSSEKNLQVHSKPRKGRRKRRGKRRG